MKSYLGRDNQACSSSIRTESKDRERNKKKRGRKNRGQKRNTKETQCEETEAEASLPRRRAAAAVALIITAGDKAD